MQYRQLGKSGVRVSVIGLGGNRFGYPRMPQEEVTRVVAAAADLGINFIDSANVYQGGAGRVPIPVDYTWHTMRAEFIGGTGSMYFDGVYYSGSNPWRPRNRFIADTSGPASGNGPARASARAARAAGEPILPGRFPHGGDAAAAALQGLAELDVGFKLLEFLGGDCRHVVSVARHAQHQEVDPPQHRQGDRPHAHDGQRAWGRSALCVPFNPSPGRGHRSYGSRGTHAGA